MMGLYDYDPEKQSPGDYTACELAFHAGDILLVYGEERPDGFFHGEVSLNLFWKAGKFLKLCFGTRGSSDFCY